MRIPGRLSSHATLAFVKTLALVVALTRTLALHSAPEFAALNGDPATLATPAAATPPLAEKSRRPTYPRPAETWLDAQIALARHGFSCGPIDGVEGPQTLAALRSFQQSAGLPPTATLDPATRERLPLDSPPLAELLLSPADFARIQPLSPTWLGKSRQTALDHETLLELLAERTHASQTLLRELNPAVNWTDTPASTTLLAPAITPLIPAKKAAQLRVHLQDRALEALDETGRTIAHFPVSIARAIEKRPSGELHVTVVIKNPDYTFDPALFPDSEEARELGRRLILPPGPNNPVGVTWIGLDLEGYGIHGTPQPEKVGRTESKGCFRLANWDAHTLRALAWVGLPVLIEP